MAMEYLFRAIVLAIGQILCPVFLLSSMHHVAHAQNSADETACTAQVAVHPDGRIAACSALIESKRYADKNLAVLHTNRGSAWRVRGDIDRAIADHSEAIRIAPVAAIYFNRAVAWRSKGDIDRARSDLQKALELEPTNHKFQDELRQITAVEKSVEPQRPPRPGRCECWSSTGLRSRC